MERSHHIKFIALLRGINVGGHTVKMDRVRELFTDLGLQHVRSYIQSGNIFFESNSQDEIQLRKKIEAYLEKSLGFPVAVCLRTQEEFEQMVQHNPFKHITSTPDIRLSVTFLSEPTAVDLTIPYITPDGGYEVVGKTTRELFVVWHLKNGRPGNSYGFIEKKLQVPTTTRFWHTAAKILQVAMQE